MASLAGHSFWCTRAGGLAAVVLVQAALGGLLVWAMRPLLWNRRWRAAEQALPIPGWVLWRSDATVAALGLLPMLGLYSLGAGAWWQQRPGWLTPWAWQAGGGWLAMVVGSWAAGLGVMRAHLQAVLDLAPAPGA